MVTNGIACYVYPLKNAIMYYSILKEILTVST